MPISSEKRYLSSVESDTTRTVCGASVIKVCVATGEVKYPSRTAMARTTVFFAMLISPV